jgi:hypothetical protein
VSPAKDDERSFALDRHAHQLVERVERSVPQTIGISGAARPIEANGVSR